MNHHVERDSLGELSIPSDAYSGIQTARAVENFPITFVPVGRLPHLVRAFGRLRKNS